MKWSVGMVHIDDLEKHTVNVNINADKIELVITADEGENEFQPELLSDGETVGISFTFRGEDFDALVHYISKARDLANGPVMGPQRQEKKPS